MRLALFAITIGLLLGFTLMGFNKGFLRTIVSMSALLLAFVFVYFMREPVTNFVYLKTPIESKVQNAVYEKLQINVEAEHAETAEEQKAAIEKTFLPSILIDSYEKEANPMTLVNEYTLGLSKHIGLLAVKTCGLVLSFILAFVVLKATVIITKIVSKVPIVGGVNKILGAVLGFARGLLIVWLVFFVITIFASTALGESALLSIKESQVLSLFYDGALSFAKIFI